MQRAWPRPPLPRSVTLVSTEPGRLFFCRQQRGRGLVVHRGTQLPLCFLSRDWVYREDEGGEVPAAEMGQARGTGLLPPGCWRAGGRLLGRLGVGIIRGRLGRGELVPAAMGRHGGGGVACRGEWTAQMRSGAGGQGFDSANVPGRVRYGLGSVIAIKRWGNAGAGVGAGCRPASVM